MSSFFRYFFYVISFYFSSLTHHSSCLILSPMDEPCHAMGSAPGSCAIAHQSKQSCPSVRTLNKPREVLVRTRYVHVTYTLYVPSSIAQKTNNYQLAKLLTSIFFLISWHIVTPPPVRITEPAKLKSPTNYWLFVFFPSLKIRDPTLIR